jgi:outer membrane receptor protein involved in Fe transport
MKMKKTVIVLLMLIIGYAMAYSATISGFITRKDSGEPLQYVNVRIKETKAGSQSNKKGYYVININSPGTYTLVATMISYLKVEKEFRVKEASEDVSFDIQMDKSSYELSKIVVTGNQNGNNEVNTPHIKVSTITQTTEDLLNTVSVAEADVFRSILTLPGVTPISDFSSGLYVRGGSPDQNLILIDDIDVYNPNHFGGIFSTFNTDAVESVELIKGGYPAKYGGRMSSVLDVTNRQGNRNYHQGVARLSLISASATVEGPWAIGSEKGSYMGSFRRTYLDILKKAFDLPDYYFYDGHWKLNWDINTKDKVSTSMYFGKDNLDMDIGDKMHIDWGNRTFSSQWVHIFNPKLFSHFVLAGSQFESNVKQTSQNGTVFDRVNSIDDITAKGIYSWKASNSHQVDFGMELKWNDTRLNVETIYQLDPNSLPDVAVSSLTSSLYVQDIWDIDDLWTLQPGLRLSKYNSLKINLPSCPKADYTNLEPRVSLRRKLDVAENVFVTYGRYYQYLTLMSMGVSTPFDLWFPLDGSLNPGVSDHYIIGYKNELSSKFALDTELYYKSYQNLLEYNMATDYTWNNQTGQLRDAFHRGKGFTYGLDTQLRNNWLGLEGFIGYTLSNTRRKMSDTNINPQNYQRQYFYPLYDKTHQVNIVETYKFTENSGIQVLGGDMKFGLNFAYSTGQPTQKPEGVFFDGEQFQILYSYKDRVRLPAYSRLDLSIKNEWTKSWGTIEPYIEMINVFNHKNIGSRDYYIVYDEDFNAILKKTDSGQFPFVPFVGVNVKW